MTLDKQIAQIREEYLSFKDKPDNEHLKEYLKLLKELVEELPFLNLIETDFPSRGEKPGRRGYLRLPEKKIFHPFGSYAFKDNGKNFFVLAPSSVEDKHTFSFDRKLFGDRRGLILNKIEGWGDESFEHMDITYEEYKKKKEAIMELIKECRENTI